MGFSISSFSHQRRGRGADARGYGLVQPQNAMLPEMRTCVTALISKLGAARKAHRLKPTKAA
jgi:hypothetical protein